MVAAAEETGASVPEQPPHPSSGSCFLCILLPASHLTFSQIVSCKRAKAHRRSEAPRSQAARNPTGVYLSGMDCVSPVSCLYESVPQQRLIEHLLGTSSVCQGTRGQQPDSDVAAVGECVVIVLFAFSTGAKIQACLSGNWQSFLLRKFLLDLLPTGSVLFLRAL